MSAPPPAPPEPPAGTEYRLLDCGHGRRLERFGPVVLDRPAPEATAPRRDGIGLWRAADGRFDRTEALTGVWTWAGRRIDGPPDPWRVRIGPVAFGLRVNDYGHVGLFPEHATLWPWATEQVAALRSRAVETAGPPVRPRVLNLFAYTGGMTLALAAAGAEVTHVDAAQAVVSAARHNAALSGLADAPIRWLTEDAARYVARELRRGRTYDGVILDPPTFGRGPGGETWKLDRDLPGLLAGCVSLLAGPGAFLLLTCHTPEWPASRLADLLEDALAVGGRAGRRRGGGPVEAGPITLAADSGATLPAGQFAFATAPR